MRNRAALLAVLLPATLVVVSPARAACAAAPPLSRFDGYLGEASSRAFYPVVESDSAAEFRVFTHAGCGGSLSVSYGTSGGTAQQGQDYQPESGIASYPNAESGADLVEHDAVSILPDAAEEAVVESTNLVLSDPVNVTLALPSVAGVLIVDDDGASRVGFEGIPYSQSETDETVEVPVFRGGIATSPETVGWSITGSSGTPATPGEDVSPTSGTVAFSSGERWKMINLALNNDQLGEGPEEFTITLAEGSPNTLTFTILDNEESEKPTSRFHHPRHKWRYKKSDYRIREFHVFASDNPGGAGVSGVEFGLKRTRKNGTCQWFTGKGWQTRDCQNREWVKMKLDPTYAGQLEPLFFYRMRQLKSSVGTKIKNYTAISRAIDASGNIETNFAQKRNDNTFEIKRSRRRR